MGREYKVSKMTETTVKLIGRGIPLMAVLGFLMGSATIIWQAGSLYNQLSVVTVQGVETKLQTDENSKEISQLKEDVSGMKAGQEQIAKNVERILNKIDSIAVKK